MYEDRIVVYIDILGFKDAIIQEGNFNKIKESIDVFNKVFEDEQKLNGIYNLDTQFVQFSDCVAFSRKHVDNNAIFDTIRDCRIITHQLINFGFLIRGSICLGKLYHKQSTIFGAAFVQAVENEKKTKYPVISYEKGLIELAEGSGQYDYLLSKSKELGDGRYYLDYFTDNVKDEFDIDCNMHYISLRKIIEDNPNNEKVKDKYLWMKEQFERTSELFNIPKL